MDGYLVFALTLALQLTSPAATHFAVDYVNAGSLESHFLVATDGSVSTFTKEVGGAQPAVALKVERSASMGQIYTARPEGSETGTASPPLSFDLSDVMKKLPRPLSAGTVSVSIDDPVQGLLNALQPAGTTPADQQQKAPTSVPTVTAAKASGTSAAAASSGTKPSTAPVMPATGSQTAASMAATGSQVATAQAPGMKLVVSKQGDVVYINLVEQKVLLIVHP